MKKSAMLLIASVIAPLFTNAAKFMELKVLDKDYREIPGAVADRSVLFGAQTPQLFHSEILKAAYKQPYDTSFTDDASVVGRTGTEIFYVPGEKYNIKLTTPEDLALASFLAESPLV